MNIFDLIIEYFVKNYLMIIISIFFIISIIITIYVYLKKIQPNDRFSFNSLSTLLQTLFVFVTLWITIYTIRSSSADSEQLFDNLKTFNSQFSNMDTSIDQVSEKLSKLPSQLNDFSRSIQLLNKIVAEQNEDFKRNSDILNETIRSLENSVKEYEGNIISYSNQLGSIVKQTDQQLLIWKEQQRAMLDEMARKPLLSLKPKNVISNKDTLIVNDLVLVNSGNIESYNRVIFIFIPEFLLDSISSEYFKFYKKDDNALVYRFNPSDTNIEIIAAESEIIIPVFLRFIKKARIELAFRIDYFSKYKSGKFADYFELK